MRYLYFVALIGLLPRLAAAQTAAVVDSVGEDGTQPVAVADQWVHSQVDSIGECTEVLYWPQRRGLVRVYHPSGRLKQYMPYADLPAARLHGVVTHWYDDGQLASQQTFIQGRREGALLLYYPDGQLKRQTQYEAGSELLGSCFSPSGVPLVYFPYEQPPLYPGGQPQLVKELKGALRKWRPTGPVQLSRAQVHVSFVVKEDGSVSNPQVTVTDENFVLLALPGGRSSHSTWPATMAQVITPLISKVQQAVTQLTKPFYPGQRDGTTIGWQYSFTIPLDYGTGTAPMGNIGRRGPNFGL